MLVQLIGAVWGEPGSFIFRMIRHTLRPGADKKW